MFAGFAGCGAKNLAVDPTCLWRPSWIFRMYFARSHRGMLSLKDAHNFVQTDWTAESVMAFCTEYSSNLNFHRI
jgi:hypothetical protein